MQPARQDLAQVMGALVMKNLMSLAPSLEMDSPQTEHDIAAWCALYVTVKFRSEVWCTLSSTNPEMMHQSRENLCKYLGHCVVLESKELNMRLSLAFKMKCYLNDDFT